MKTNTKPVTVRTYEGGIGQAKSPTEELRSAVLTCLLWENTFYESGGAIAKRLQELVPKVPAKVVADLAIEARTKHGLRHVSLFLARELAKHPQRQNIRVSGVIEQVICRADELAEFLSLYWKEGRTPLAGQVKKGLAKAFKKFSAYNLAKYNNGDKIKLRDVLFMSHAKPKDEAQAAVWKQLVDGTLPAPDTWEVALSAGEDKKTTWERLIEEKKLGGLATLRNLRNMTTVGLGPQVMEKAVAQANYNGVLPFQFFAAAKHAPRMEQALEPAMLKAIEELPMLRGTTAFLIDVSGSMDTILSNKGTLNRLDAACALAVLLREKCERVQMYTFSSGLVEVPPRRGFALRDAIMNSQPHGSTYLAAALTKVKSLGTYDRLMVMTDEQSHDGSISAFAPAAYSINVAPYQPGLNYGGGWTKINGWSERVVDYIHAVENQG